MPLAIPVVCAISLLALCRLSNGAEPPPAISPLPAADAKARQQAWARHLGVPIERTDSVGIKLVLIPPGEFTMGSPPTEQGRAPGETPHRVAISKAFYMGAGEVTQAQWKALMGGAPSFFEGETLPVETVTWDEAAEFCRKLSAKENASYGLPTEAQWEYACRAGTTSPFNTGDTIGTDQANYNGNHVYAGGRKGVFRETTTLAGTLPPNAWGVHDMHGNVWEWCADWHAQYPAGDARDPAGPAQGKTRVIRGGCWINDPAVCRSANRGDTAPMSWNFNFGFRIVRLVEAKLPER